MLAKIINKNTNEVEVAFGTDENYFKSIGMTEMEVEQAHSGQWYLKGYAPVYTPTIQEQITALESQQTPRRIREAMLGNEESLSFIEDIEAQIEVLRRGFNE